MSERERAVLQRLVDGMKQEQIAASEGMSLRTVKRTVERLHEKLDAPSLCTLGKRATQLGLVR